MVSRKVAVLSGDVRRALHICRRAVERCAAQAEADATGAGREGLSNPNALFARHASRGRLSPTTRPRVGLDQIKAAAAELVQQNHMLVMARLAPLPRLVLVAVALELSKSGTEDVSFDRVAQRVRVEAVRVLGALGRPCRADLQSVCRVLGAARLLLVDTPRAHRDIKIRLNMQLDDVYFALQNDKQVGPLLR